MKITCAAAFLLTACGSDGQLNVRAIPGSPSMSAKPVPARIAEARGHLAMNNVALALEGFRKARREDPGSIDALMGIAASYERMGRFDLSRRYFEMALAFDPANAGILTALARSLDAQGLRAQAAKVRSEMAERSAPADPMPVAGAAATIAPAPAGPSGTITLPPATPAMEPAPVQAIGPARAAAIPEGNAALADAGPSPAVQNGSPPRSAASVSVPQSGPRRTGPRLERMSLGEVALVTVPRERWRGEVVQRTASSTTVRFVPLRTAQSEVSVRLLNAARYQALAARTRVALNGKGWTRVSIGDAERVREKSLVLYSRATADAARRLAAELGIGLARDPRPGQLTVLLGRDVRPDRRSRG